MELDWNALGIGIACGVIAFLSIKHAPEGVGWHNVKLWMKIFVVLGATLTGYFVGFLVLDDRINIGTGR